MAVHGTLCSAGVVLPHAGVIPLPQRPYAFTTASVAVAVAVAVAVVATVAVAAAVAAAIALPHAERGELTKE